MRHLSILSHSKLLRTTLKRLDVVEGHILHRTKDESTFEFMLGSFRRGRKVVGMV